MTRDVINTWDQLRAAGGSQVAISCRAATPRACQPSAWQVWRLVDGREIATDPGGHWADRGSKTFPYVGREDKERARLEAFAWARKTFGDIDFVRNRMGDFVARNVNERFPLRKREPPRRAAIDK